MCTAISVNAENHYFGRNLDYEHSFGEKITITPRNFPFKFTNGKEVGHHYAIIGMALPVGGYPLYFDAVNEKGLGMAGLHFPKNAVYNEKDERKDNVASFELISRILSRCDGIKSAKELIERLNITKEPFSDDIQPSPLHWIVADRDGCITVEQTSRGLEIYENREGILTNNPTFDMHMFNLTNYLSVSAQEPENSFSDKLVLDPCSRGYGGIGLPGDFSSASRFVKGAFMKLNTIYGDSEEERVSSFFRVLYSVFQQKGCVRTGENHVITHYSSCCNADKGIYYYTTYKNNCVNGVDMHRENLDGDKIKIYPLEEGQKFNIRN